MRASSSAASLAARACFFSFPIAASALLSVRELDARVDKAVQHVHHQIGEDQKRAVEDGLSLIHIFYLGAGFLSGFLTAEVLCELSILGGVLIAASGLSILKIKNCKTMELLPCLLVPLLFFAARRLAGLG